MHINVRNNVFVSQVREEENWCKQICFELESESVPRDLDQITSQHHIIEMEIEARLSAYDGLRSDGESLLTYDIFRNQVIDLLNLRSFKIIQ